MYAQEQHKTIQTTAGRFCVSTHMHRFGPRGGRYSARVYSAICVDPGASREVIRGSGGFTQAKKDIERKFKGATA
jgi:hypothetical protein